MTLSAKEMRYILVFAVLLLLSKYVKSGPFSWPQNINLERLFDFHRTDELCDSMKDLYRASLDKKCLNQVKLRQTFKKLATFLGHTKISHQDDGAATFFKVDPKSSSMFQRSVSGLSGGQTSKKKVLILISDTGGGHRASAQAIDQALAKFHKGRVDVCILDIWTDYAKWPFNKFVPTYRFLARHPLLWRGFYAYGGFPPTRLFTEICSKISSYQSFKRAIVQRSPDIVVSMHPLCQLMPLSIVSEMNKERSVDAVKVPFVTIVTDLGAAHSTWFDKRADYVFVPSEDVRQIALKCGIRSDKIVVRGLPIRPAFWSETQPKNKLRERLGLCQDCKTVLVMGGGDGVGKLFDVTAKIGEKLSQRNGKSEIIVVCGHNSHVANKLQSMSWPSNVNVKVKGFVNNIDEYMGASDCIVTKAGPGTIAEAMVRKLPVILSSFLPGQEAGNVPFVINGKFGLYPGQKPQKIADSVYKLCMDDELLKFMSENASKLSRPQATQLIAKDIASIVFAKRREEIQLH